MKTSRLSLNQMFTLMVLFLIASPTLTTVGRMSGQDVWIVVLIASVIGLVLFLMFYRISRLHSYAPLWSIIQDSFGKWLGGLIVLGYSGYFLYLATSLLKSTGDMIQFTLLPQANLFVVNGLLMLAVVYGMILGINAVGRSSELLFYVVILLLIPLILCIFTSDIFKFDNFLPVLEKGFYGIRRDIYTVTLVPFGELVCFLAIFPLIPEKRQSGILKISLISILVGTFIIVILDILNVGILGPDLAKNFVYPFYNAMKMIGVGVFFERLDPIAILILMMTCFFKMAVYFYSGVVCLDGLMSRFTYRQLAIPVGIIVVVAGGFISENRVQDLYRAIHFNSRYVHPAFQLAIPLLLWLISEFKYRKHPRQIKTETSN